MQNQTTPPARAHRSNVAQLKDDIDTGRTGDKVGGFDPGAAPLGTDDEAGGVPPNGAMVAETRILEAAGRPENASPNASTPELQPNARLPDTHGAARAIGLPVLVGVIAAAVLALLLMMVL